MVIDLPGNMLEGKTVTIIGGGPSLTGFDWNRLQGYVIGTNHSPKFHRADMLCAIDVVFHMRESGFLDGFEGLKVTYVPTERKDFIVAKLEPDHANYSRDLDWHILKANLSGYFAIAVALHFGAMRVYLLGFDGGYSEGDNPNFHEYSYEGPGMNYYYPQNQYYSFFRGKPIVNVGLDSKINAFTKVPLNSDFYGIG